VKATLFDAPLVVTIVRLTWRGALPRSGTVRVQEVCDGQEIGAAWPPNSAVICPFVL
jgi:hypothetical protein